ncbi:hypothetical protein KY311_00620 [Candidatus Woesearchaeota archaeon]|nr:hypothetical protein [Candidatus Woesearchaeota archaeon]
MGWFNKIFSKEIKEESVKFSELSEWFEKKSRPEFQHMEKEAKKAHAEADHIIKDIRKALEKLEKAELINPNIQPKMKQFMSGNRENYIKQVSILINNLPGLSEYYFEQMQTALNNFTQSSARSYAILQEFFANEAKHIAAEIKKLDDIARLVNDIYTNKRILLLREIGDKIKQVNERSSMKKELRQSIQQLDSEIKNLISEIDELNHFIDEKRTSPDFDILKKLNDEKSILEARLKNTDFGFNDLFSPLKKPLRKYARIALSHENLIENYSSAPLRTLLKDNELKIIDILDNMKQRLDKLNFDESSQAKIAQRIELFNKEKFTKTIESYRNTESDLLKVQEKIDSISVAAQIEEAKEKMQAIQSTIDRKQRMINEQQHRLESIDIGNEIESIKQLLEPAFEIKLNINL